MSNQKKTPTSKESTLLVGNLYLVVPRIQTISEIKSFEERNVNHIRRRWGFTADSQDFVFESKDEAEGILNMPNRIYQ